MFARQPNTHRKRRFRVDPDPPPQHQRLSLPVFVWRRQHRQHQHRLEPPVSVGQRPPRHALIPPISERRLPRSWLAAMLAPTPTLAHRRRVRRGALLASLACLLLIALVAGLFLAPWTRAHTQVSVSTPAAGSRGLQPAGRVGVDGEQTSNDLTTLPFASLHQYVPAAGLQPPAVQAAAAFLFDPQSGLVLYEKNADEQRSIASLTKIMTLLLGADAGDLDQMVTVGPDAAALVTSANSYMGVSTGEQLTLRDLLYGLAVGSGNDAAVAIADGISGTEGSFVVLMNSRARRLGLTQTLFVSPDGLDDANRSTAHDLAILTAIALETPGVEQITATSQYQIPQTATHKAYDLVSSNELLPGGRASYPGANGVKTGYTERALYCLAFSAQRQGHLLVGVVLGDPSADARDTDAHALLDWGFAQE